MASTVTVEGLEFTRYVQSTCKITGGDPEKFKDLVGSGVQVHILEPVLQARYGG